ncbi:MAG: putative PEP-binding protein [Paracoccaceae bacterium]
MQKELSPEIVLVDATAPMRADVHGGRAKCLQRLVRLDMPVPTTVALSFAAVRRIAQGRPPDMARILGHYAPDTLLSVRPSSQDPDWGGPGAVLNIGMTSARADALADRIGEGPAMAAQMRFIQGFATNVAWLDADAFDAAEPSRAARDEMLSVYEAETDEPFPMDVATQLGRVLAAMARAWDGTSARLLRQAKGAPADAGLGLVVQAMARGFGDGSGIGVVQFVDGATGAPAITGRWLPGGRGRSEMAGSRGRFIASDPRGPALQDDHPEVFDRLLAMGAVAREKLREEMQIEFALADGHLQILDALRIQRSARAGLSIAVSLAEDGVIPRAEAVRRIAPATLSELLHRQVAPGADRDVLGRGIAASPGAATGRIVFTSAQAQAMASRDEPCILVRRETTPEDVRGMHAAQGVVTIRGGATSHAAVIGRGLGLPCVVGASDLRIDRRARALVAEGGRTLAEGDVITVDGTSGQVLVGAPDLLEAALDGGFRTLLTWADEIRDIGVRANADTPQDAATAAHFKAEGIGLCRTEHMFFDDGRLPLMREMIFADGAEARRAVLARLLPMQREDFTQLFRIMDGRPVCIRLFDPPLHEFLPADKPGMRELAEGLGLPLTQVTDRVEELAEYNPMLGMRGVRLGVTIPEIYDMQARAIFEATVEAARDGAHVVPEIMVPLVSARREVELVRRRIEAIAATVQGETGTTFDYALGVMVETPRAALRAGEIAQDAAFLSFGTNDLTQMAYGLSRDDAGRFMSDYVRQGVFPEDPFHAFDVDGVGELVSMGAERGRAARPGVKTAICGEHAGTRAAIAFARAQGMDYVSCSPFRVPIARLTAAQIALDGG